MFWLRNKKSNFYSSFFSTGLSSSLLNIQFLSPRCRLPNGKTIWLCDRHRNSMKVTILGTEAVASDKQLDTGNDISNYLIEGLRVIDHQKYSSKFKSTRKSLRRKDSK